ncbi:MAG: molecular chaperone [Proteobacteria bacterium]|nr:molecular chaperone [Pseudomonadota bacterium]
MKHLPALIACMIAAAPAVGGTFSVSPIRIELNAHRPTAILTVRNEEDVPVVVQALPYAWLQEKSQEQLQETRQLIITPAIFTLAPRGEQILRIAATSPPDVGRELPFRIVLNEIPAPAPLGFTGLRIALRISLPAFLAAQPAAVARLEWSYRLLPGGALFIQAHNAGAAHLQVDGFDVMSADGRIALHTDTAHYVLPGATAAWRLPGAPPGAPPAQLLIHGQSDGGNFSATGRPDPDT